MTTRSDGGLKSSNLYDTTECFVRNGGNPSDQFSLNEHTYPSLSQQFQKWYPNQFEMGDSQIWSKQLLSTHWAARPSWNMPGASDFSRVTSIPPQGRLSHVEPSPSLNHWFSLQGPVPIRFTQFFEFWIPIGVMTTWKDEKLRDILKARWLLCSNEGVQAFLHCSVPRECEDSHTQGYAAALATVCTPTHLSPISEYGDSRAKKQKKFQKEGFRTLFSLSTRLNPIAR